MAKLKLMTIVGTRPEIIRLAAVIKKCDKYFDQILVHTGQNYDYNLNGVFFKDLKLADPEVYLDAIFISIHMNWFSDSSCRGTEIYYADNSDSSMLATCVRDSIVKSIQPTNNRKIKKGSGIYLLEHSDNPAILIECGFLSNPEECEKLSQKEYQKELSFSIVCGIIEYIEK